MNKISVLVIVFLLVGTIFTWAQEWTVYTNSTHDIPGNQVNSVFIDTDNIKWFGTDRGLVSFNGLNWYTHPILTAINKIEGDSSSQSDQLLIATDSGTVRIRIVSADSIEILEEYRTDNSGILSDKCLSLAADGNDVSWIGTDSGLSIRDGSDFINLTDQDWKLPFNIIREIKKRLDGFRYLATQGGGVARLQYNDVDGITAASVIDIVWSQLPSDTINAIHFDSENTAWYGTNYGLSKHTGNDIKSKWDTFTKNDGLVNDTVLAITQDLESTIWIGTADGVSRFSGTKWESWSTSDQSAGDSVLSISQDNDGSMWICTNRGILNFSSPPISIYENNGKAKIPELNLALYPNPFNPSTTIYFEIAEQSKVKLALYNTLGQLVGTLVNETKSPNSYKFQFNAGNLPAGIYYCRLSAGPATVVKKMLYIK